MARKREADGTLSLPLLAIVDADAPGLERTLIPTVEPGANKQWQLFFDDVEVDEDRIVGGEDAGLKAAFDGLNPERIMGAAVCNGTSRRALEMAVRVRARAEGVERRRSALTRASRTRSRRRRSSSSWRA